nr:hypothetical protein [Tanacetum cinerariifolium]
MNKSWMNIYDRINDTRYEAGVIEFLDFAYHGRDESLAIPCPSRSCNNFCDKNKETMYNHLMQNGITRGYITWNYHGEESENNDDGGGDDVPFDGIDGGGDDMSDDDLDEISYSIWPVFIVSYNLPPWKCMKDPYMFMSMFIPGPKTPVNINVYLEPLIDKVKDLWVGVNAYDELRKEDFTLRAALLWTINDFSTYADNREPIAPKSGDEVLHDIDCSIGVSHSMVNQKKRESSVIPMACYHLTKDEKHKISNLLMSLKFPDGLASNISSEHKVELEEEIFNHVNERHDKEFASWLQQRVNTHLHLFANEIQILSHGPLNSVHSYSRCMVNGYKFHTQTREENRTCQNRGNKRVLVFKCKQFKVDNANGLQVDKESGSTCINTSRKWRNWYVVESNDPRILYNVPVEEVAERHCVEEIYQEEELHLNVLIDSNLNQPSLTRDFCSFLFLCFTFIVTTINNRSVATFVEHGNMNTSGIQNNEEMVNQGLPLVGNQEQRKINASGIQNNEEMVNPSRQNLKQKEYGNMNASGIQNNEEMEHRRMNDRISDHSMKSKNPSRIWYSGSGPRKGAFKRLDSQNPSTNHDRHPINKEHGYLRFQDKESVIHEDNVTMENLYREDHQEYEVNSPQTNTVTSAHHQENIASNSNGTTITRKESRALNTNRKNKFNQRKLVFEIDDCARRIIEDDSQTFITKGGCVVRECAVFDGRT